MADNVHYQWLTPGSIVYWIRSSEEQPFVWTLFKGQISAAWDVCNRFWYHCALTEIIADKSWVDSFVANHTYRFIAIDNNKAEHIYLYSDCTTNDKQFIEDWRHYYAQNYLWDLSADLVFTCIQDAIKALQTIYDKNAHTFLQIMKDNEQQLQQLQQLQQHLTTQNH